MSASLQNSWDASDPLSGPLRKSRARRICHSVHNSRAVLTACGTMTDRCYHLPAINAHARWSRRDSNDVGYARPVAREPSESPEATHLPSMRSECWGWRSSNNITDTPTVRSSRHEQEWCDTSDVRQPLRRFLPSRRLNKYPDRPRVRLIGVLHHQIPSASKNCFLRNPRSICSNMSRALRQFR